MKVFTPFCGIGGTYTGVVFYKENHFLFQTELEYIY